MAWGIALLIGCESTEPSGSLFKPVRVDAPAEACPEVAPAEGGFDFEADGRDEAVEAGTSEATAAELLAGQGLSAATAEAASAPGASTTPEAAPPAAEAAAVPAVQIPTAWTGVGTPVSWGVRLVSTVPEAQPPRAILGLPDGSEAVVQPGTLLPGPGLVVLAVGRDAVQLAEVKGEGDHARVTTTILTALYPGLPQAR
jgi:hypothetical protein